MSVKEPSLNEFGCVFSTPKRLPEDGQLVGSINKYDYVLQHRLSGVEVLDAAAYVSLPDDLLELRAFNREGELHLVNVEGKLFGRVRTDVPSKDAVEVAVFDEEHQLWGSSVSQHDGVVELKEERGTAICLPESIVLALPNILKVTKRRQPTDGKPSYTVTIRVRNYLGDEETDPESGDTSFSFVDYRLMGFNVREVK